MIMFYLFVFFWVWVGWGGAITFLPLRWDERTDTQEPAAWTDRKLMKIVPEFWSLTKIGHGRPWGKKDCMWNRWCIKPNSSLENLSSRICFLRRYPDDRLFLEKFQRFPSFRMACFWKGWWPRESVLDSSAVASKKKRLSARLTCWFLRKHCETRVKSMMH